MACLHLYLSCALKHTHHFAARVEQDGQHADVDVDLVAQAAESGRHGTREAGSRLVTGDHSQPLVQPASRIMEGLKA